MVARFEREQRHERQNWFSTRAILFLRASVSMALDGKEKKTDLLKYLHAFPVFFNDSYLSLLLKFNEKSSVNLVTTKSFLENLNQHSE